MLQPDGNLELPPLFIRWDGMTVRGLKISWKNCWRVDSYKNNIDRISLVGASAGASVVLNVFGEKNGYL